MQLGGARAAHHAAGPRARADHPGDACAPAARNRARAAARRRRVAATVAAQER